MTTRLRNVTLWCGAPVIALLSGCGVGVEPLMPTPVLYTECGFDPLDHIPETERWVARRVYYATDRRRAADEQQIAYGNHPGDEVSVGLALVGFGGPGMTWADLRRVSTETDRDPEVILSIAGLVEGGRFPIDASVTEASAADRSGWLLEDFNDAIEDARSKDVLVYVHGAKVNFYNGCAFAAQLDHFMGRDMTSMAYSWPTRQDIFAYAFGSDRQRAYDSGAALASLLEVLAMRTDAERIHILSWSAGARVTTEALVVLRRRHAGEGLESLRERFRLGTVYFAAGDIPTDEFLDALPIVHDISGRTVVTVADDDEALITAEVIMGGAKRIGQTGKKLTEEEVRMIESLDRLEVINVSHSADLRGFDITGHRYWFNHPWASSDVLLAIRTDLRPGERGLVQGDSPVVWYMPDDYPQRLRQAMEEAQWSRW